MADVAYHADVLVARAPFAPHPRSRRATVFVALGVALLALAALFVAGGTAGIVLAACIALLPLAIYLSAHAPLIFPFGLYVAVIPFDSILFVSGSGSTIARVLGLMSAVALLIGTYHRRAVRPGWSWVGWLLAMLWIAATALWTVDPHLTSQAVTQMLSLFGLFTVIAVYPASRRELYWLLAIVVVVGAGSALYGLYDHISVAHLATDNRVSFETQSGIFVDPNHYAANFLLPIAIAVAGLLFARSIGSRIVFGTAAATMAFGVLLSGSRGALISLAAVLLYLAIRTKRVREIAAVAGAGALLSLAYPLVWQRFLDPTQGDASGRFSVWKIAWAAAMDHFHWLYGAGFGAFPAIYDRVFLTVYEHDFTGWSRVGHNLIAQSVVETGVIGLALIAFAWYRTWRAPQVVPKGDGLYPWRIALEAATLGLFVTALSVDLLWFKYPWLCFSIAVLVRNVYVREHQRQGHFMHVQMHAATTPAPSREANETRLQVVA